MTLIDILILVLILFLVFGIIKSAERLPDQDDED